MAHPTMTLETNHRKTIFISGASSGFGKLAASLLLADGHTVVAAIRGGEARLAGLFSREEIATGRLLAVDLHLDRPETLAAAERFVAERLGGALDVLVNNAGYGALGPIEEQSEHEIRRQLEVNVVGPMLLTNKLLPALRARRGRILNVTGAVGFVPMPFYALYCASKHALEGYSESLAYDLAPFGVQVGIVQPGGFRTGFTETAAAIASTVPQGSPYKDRARAMTDFLRTEAVKLNGDPLVVAKKLVKLCTARRLPIRTKVGPDAIMLSLLSWLVPARAKMWLIATAMSRTLFNPKARTAELPALGTPAE